MRVEYEHNSKVKRNKKRRALRGKQRVELVINRLGKRTVMLLNPSFFYFFNPLFVMRHAWDSANLKHCARNSEKINQSNMIKIILLCLFSNVMFCSCIGQSLTRSDSKNKLKGYDYNLFQETPVWNLAKAVSDEDTAEIRKIISDDKVDIDFQETRFGNTLLMLSVWNKQYRSCQTLLELGADPNKHNKYNGSSAIIEAAKINGVKDDNTKFLKLLLQYKGNPNDVEVGERQEGNTTRKTPLIAAIQVNNNSSSLLKVQLLVDAGADINYSNEYGQTVLREAVLIENYAVVLFLLQHGANSKELIVDRAKFQKGGKKMYLVDMIKEYQPDANSDDSKLKTEILDFLKKKGIE